MKLKDQVVSLGLAKRLKELGVKQESLFWWYQLESKKLKDKGAFDYEQADMPWDINFWAAPMSMSAGLGGNAYCQYSAFTVAELEEMLPHFIRSINPNTGNEAVYYLHYWMLESGEIYLEYTTARKQTRQRDLTHCAHWVASQSEADARAKMLIYSLENNLTRI